MTSLHTQAVSAIEAAKEDLLRLSHAVHAEAELSFDEHRSVQHVVDVLSRHQAGVDVGVYGLPTAFRATAGAGAPRVAILAEYDALPGIGHGCGHNVICATAVGAFLGVADVVAKTGGSVVLLGTPAEEDGTGKEVLAQAGAFDDVDAVVMLHPFAGGDVANFEGLGSRDVQVTYSGRASHASAAPHLGRNALDAVVLAYQGIAALRQHMRPTERLHGIITDGGQATNVVPETSSATFSVRSDGEQALFELCDRVHAVFEGAALQTGTTVDARWDPQPPYLPVRSNTALAARYATHVAARGRTIVDFDPTPTGGGGSTDLGNVSLRVPSIHPALGIAPAQVGMHTVEFAEHARGATADHAVIDGAIGLALTALDFLADPDLRDRVASEFESAGGAIDVASLLKPHDGQHGSAGLTPGREAYECVPATSSRATASGPKTDPEGAS